MKKLKLSSLNKNLSYTSKLFFFISNNLNKVEEEFWLPQTAPSYINKNLKNAKLRRFCVLTKRSRSHYKKIRLSRIKIRNLINSGLLCGVRKSSW